MIGGGSRSAYWGRMLASILNRPLIYREGGEVGPALGAARLARYGISGDSVSECFREPPEAFVAEPDAALVPHYADRLERYRALYQTLRETFRTETR